MLCCMIIAVFLLKYYSREVSIHKVAIYQVPREVSIHADLAGTDQVLNSPTRH